MWCYKILKTRDPNLTREEAIARVTRGCVLFEVFQDDSEEAILGNIYVKADLTDERAFFLTEHPELLPGAIRVAWVALSANSPLPSNSRGCPVIDGGLPLSGNVIFDTLNTLLKVLPVVGQARLLRRVINDKKLTRRLDQGSMWPKAYIKDRDHAW